MRSASALLLALLCAAGCSGPGAERAPLHRQEPGGFPPEPGPEAFPGITYPTVDGPLPRPGRWTGPVWLVGVDGATWKIIRPMAGRGELPHLSRLMEEGAHGVLRSEDPTISPALWATIATGVPRFRHGVTNFRVKVPASYRLVQAGPPDRREPALWEMVGAAGGTSAVISWYGSYPAEEIAGQYVSKGFDPDRPGKRQTHPPELAGRLSRDAKVRMRRRDLEEIGWNEDYRKTLIEDARAMAALEVILGRDNPDFVAVYFSGIDVVQHVAWGHMDPESRAFPEDGEADSDLGGIIPAYYRYIDDSLGRIREMAPEGTTFVIVSDHGGGPMGREEAFVPVLPRLLEAMGLMEGETGPLFTMSQPYRYEKPIWINLEGTEPRGIVPEARVLPLAAVAAQRLTDLRTEHGEPVFASVRNLAAEPGWRPGDPALSVRFTYAARTARTISDGGRTFPASDFVSRLPGVSGSHRPDGIIILAGPSIRPGPLASEANLYQVAPTILYLLGLPQDARMLSVAPAAGGVLQEAILPGVLEDHPVRMIDHYPGVDRSGLLRDGEGGREAPPDPAHQREMEKLRSLGYVQ